MGNHSNQINPNTNFDLDIPGNLLNKQYGPAGVTHEDIEIDREKDSL